MNNIIICLTARVFETIHGFHPNDRPDLPGPPVIGGKGVTDSGENHRNFGRMQLQIRVDLGVEYGMQLQIRCTRTPDSPFRGQGRPAGQKLAKNVDPKRPKPQKAWESKKVPDKNAQIGDFRDLASKGTIRGPSAQGPLIVPFEARAGRQCTSDVGVA
ncbi:hypothetical protein GGX14DRAFT_384264 [Mycena pura]|uniref:Uncharacterized protein n=1 Tax=Mycena pura TaxID=153505 RepID=A0AAD6YVG7_9AGAR|nr:hypothetical protein GGX14DRAFT_384264 [Mycena pura]